MIRADPTATLGENEVTGVPSRRPESVELETWEWQLLLHLLGRVSGELGVTDVGGRLVGDRLHTIRNRIETQVGDYDG